MLEIKRSNYCVIAYDESEGRGIAFPANDSISINGFVEELQELAEDMKPGLVIVSLVFDPKYDTNYCPMSKYLEGKEGPQILNDDNEVKGLYDFYFSHSIPEISPMSINYIFLG